MMLERSAENTFNKSTFAEYTIALATVSLNDTFAEIDTFLGNLNILQFYLTAYVA